MTEKGILELRPFEARLIDTSKFRVIPFGAADKPPEKLPVDTRTIFVLPSDQAILVDTTKIRVVPPQTVP